MTRVLTSLMLTLLVLSALARAEVPGQEVFVTTGEHGEVSFSDVSTPGAERRTLPAIERDDDALAELDRRIQQTLDVARVLEESRLAREKARAEARAATEPPPVIVTVEERYVRYPYVYAPQRHGRFGPHRPHKPGRDQPPPAEPSADEVLSSRMIWRKD
jgi:hypothetical protein